jgi:hypothetical protein
MMGARIGQPVERAELGYGLDDLGVMDQFPAGQEVFTSCSASRATPGHIQFPVQFVSRHVPRR